MFLRVTSHEARFRAQKRRKSLCEVAELSAESGDRRAEVGRAAPLRNAQRLTPNVERLSPDEHVNL
jgi:hypothetical protein